MMTTPNNPIPSEEDNSPIGVEHAVTWKLVADVLARHHQRRDLRVFELHPAGGMGDTLSLRDLQDGSLFGSQLNDFRGWRRMGMPGVGRHPDALVEDVSYVRGALNERTYEPTLRGVLHALGLEDGCPTPFAQAPLRVQSHHLMAALLWPMKDTPHGFQWRSGILDTSGYPGTGPRDAFDAEKNGFHRLTASLSGARRSRLNPLYDIWFMTTESAPSNPPRDAIRLAIHVATATLWLNLDPPEAKEHPSTEEPLALRDALERHGSMEQLVQWLWSTLLP